jgi:hypothetical protein
MLPGMNPYPSNPYPAPAPPPRKSNKRLVVVLILVPVLVIGGCVGAFLAVPVLGGTLLGKAPSANTQPADVAVRGDWASADGKVTLLVDESGEVHLSAPGIISCIGRLDKNHKHNDSRYPFTVKTDYCGDVKMGQKGALTLAGDKLSLTLGSLSAELVKKP